MSLSSSSSSQSTQHHCRCCRFSNQRIIGPSVAYSRRNGIKRLFCKDDNNDDTTLIRLPPLSDVCKRYAGLSVDSTCYHQSHVACFSGPDLMEQRSEWQDHTTTVDVFLAEFRRRPSTSAIAFWAQMRPRVCKLHIVRCYCQTDVLIQQCDRCFLEGKLCEGKKNTPACLQCAHHRCSRVEDERCFHVMNTLQLSRIDYFRLRSEYVSDINPQLSLKKAV